MAKKFSQGNANGFEWTLNYQEPLTKLDDHVLVFINEKTHLILKYSYKTLKDIIRDDRIYEIPQLNPKHYSVMSNSISKFLKVVESKL